MISRPRASSRTLAALVLGAVAWACSNSESPTALRAVAPASTPPSSATVGSSVAAPSVVVTDADGKPVAGVSVTFTVTAGAGAISPASPATVVTDSAGHARLTSWTLDTISGPNVVTASGTGLMGSPVAFSVAGIAGPASAARSTVTADSIVTASIVTHTAKVTVTGKDAYGNAVQSASVIIGVSGGGTNTITQPTGATNAAGVISGFVACTLAGSHAISATINGIAITQTATLTVRADSVSYINFTQTPTSVVANSQFSVTVTALDNFGNVATSYSGSVSVSIAIGVAGATLSGTTTVSAVNGVATFTDLAIDKPGTNYQLEAFGTGIVPGVPVSSPFFDVSS